MNKWQNSDLFKQGNSVNLHSYCGKLQKPQPAQQQIAFLGVRKHPPKSSYHVIAHGADKKQ